MQRAIARELVNHRGPEFRELLHETEELLRPLFGTENRVLFFAASGTGMMEASLANILAPGDRVLVMKNGQWGERFAAIAAAYGARVDSLEFPWGTAPDPEAIGEKLASAHYRAVLITHNESSTGVVADVARIGERVRGSDALLVVDAVSSLACVEVDQDGWGADIVISASQKGLMCPPGLGLASVSERAWRVVREERSTPRFYWDFRKAAAAAEKSETPFTPAISLIGGLREALLMIHQEGVANVLERHARLALALRAGCDALGLKSFPEPPAASNSVTALTVPEGLDGGEIVKTLYRNYRTVIAGSRNRLAGRVIRIGTMGSVSEADILADLHFLAATLNDLESAVDLGAGVAAGSEMLRG
ncbi:MAG TPA: alanine--glyoxylate aminotransferase family protein [Trueperaceae bacterium]